MVSAGPLLVASQTRDPLLVSMALLSEYLPVLLFGVLGGAVADPFDRRRMVVVVNVGRALVLGALVAVIVTGTVSIAAVLAVLFVLGTAETFVDSASSTLVPGLVAREDLGIANALLGRVSGVYRVAIIGGLVVGTPLGGLLARSYGITAPFWFAFAGSALLVTILWRQFDHIVHAGAQLPH